MDQPLAPTAIDPTIRSQIAYLDTSLSGPSLIRQRLSSLTRLLRKTLRRQLSPLVWNLASWCTPPVRAKPFIFRLLPCLILQPWDFKAYRPADCGRRPHVSARLTATGDGGTPLKQCGVGGAVKGCAGNMLISCLLSLPRHWCRQAASWAFFQPI